MPTSVCSFGFSFSHLYVLARPYVCGRGAGGLDSEITLLEVVASELTSQRSEDI